MKKDEAISLLYKIERLLGRKQDSNSPQETAIISRLQDLLNDANQAADLYDEVIELRQQIKEANQKNAEAKPAEALADAEPSQDLPVIFEDYDSAMAQYERTETGPKRIDAWTKVIRARIAIFDRLRIQPAAPPPLQEAEGRLRGPEISFSLAAGRVKISFPRGMEEKDLIQGVRDVLAMMESPEVPITDLDDPDPAILPGPRE